MITESPRGGCRYIVRSVRTRRLRPRYLILLLTVSAVVICCSAIVEPVYALTPTSLRGTSLFLNAIQDAKGSRWVHEVIRVKTRHNSFTSVDDIGETQGRQLIESGQVRIQLILTGKGLFVRANPEGLTSYLNMPKNQLNKFAERWIVLSPANPYYSTLSAAMTLRTDFDQQLFTGPLRQGPEILLHGQRVVSLMGRLAPQSHSARGTIYVLAETNRPLPIELNESTPAVSYAESWSRWGQRPLAVRAPAGALPLN